MKSASPTAAERLEQLMWEFLGRQLLKEAGRKIGSRFFNDEANGPEAYADRITKDFGLNDYVDAWALYNSDPAYWENYYSERPREPDWRSTAVRDSAAAAGVPSRNNVFEYGFPQSAPTQTSSKGAPLVRKLTRQSTLAGSSTNAKGRTGEGHPDPLTRELPASSPRSELGQRPLGVVTTGAPPVPQPSSTPQNRPGGLPSKMIDAGFLDPADPDPPPASGLAGLIRDYLRNNPGISR